MDVLLERVAGIDVHKKTVVICCRIVQADGSLTKELRTFGTMTGELLAVSDWLTQQGITHVALESTGEFWKPVYNLLEANFTVLVVNPQHMKNVPGRKTDCKDAEWIAELLCHGLLRASFIPPLPQRDLRDLTRQRMNLVRERATVVNRLQKVLEWANLKLAAVATDILGVSARAMLEAIVDGQSDVSELAAMARGRMRSKRAELEQALEGRVRDHHRFLIARHLLHIDFLDEQIADFDEHIVTAIHAQSLDTNGISIMSESAPERHEQDGVAQPSSEADVLGERAPLTWDEAVSIWDDIPGIGRRVAEQLVAEVGTDMQRFPSASHLASWAKLSPGNHESAGKRSSSRIGHGNQWLRSTLIQAAHAAVKVRGSYLSAFYRRLVARRGVKKAIVAVARKLLTIAYTLLCKRERYEEPGVTYLDERRKDRLLNQMRSRIERLGYSVILEPRASAA